MMRRIVIIVLLCTVLLPLCGQSLNEAQIKQKINQTASALKSMQCDFVQTKQTKLLSSTGVSTGHLYYDQPYHLRWEYLTPTAHTFEINGQKVLMSDHRGSREVDIRRNRMYKEMARLMTDIMSGQSLVSDKDFQVSLAPDNEKKTEWVATLVPRRKEVRHMFASIILRVSSAKWLVHQVELVEPKGDRTVIELNHVVVNGIKT